MRRDALTRMLPLSLSPAQEDVLLGNRGRQVGHEREKGTPMCDADERSRQLPRRKFLRALTTGAATVAATGGGAALAYGSSSAAEASGGSTVVAAADAPAVVKATAKYVCDGSGDEVEINQALAEFGDVELSTGTFVLDYPIRPTQTTGFGGTATPPACGPRRSSAPTPCPGRSRGSSTRSTAGVAAPAITCR